MRIRIQKHDWGDYSQQTAGCFCDFAENVGLRYIENSSATMFDVIDEKLFMFSIIKYGIRSESMDSYKDC